MTVIAGHPTVRRLRLLSGLVMFVYLTEHLLNHALAVFSLVLAESGLQVAILFWRNPIATFFLYGSAALHVGLALWTLWSRREWNLPWIELIRLGAGFSFPLLLIGHAVTTRLGDTLFNIHPTYNLIVAGILAQGRQGLQLALLAPGWLHGCLGLWITLRRFDTMQRLRSALIALMIFIPVAAAVGFARMAAVVSAVGPRPDAGPAQLAAQLALVAWKDRLTIAYLASVAGVFLLGRGRALITKHGYNGKC
jgi:adenylate cyclase